MSDKVAVSGTIKLEDQASPTIRKIQQSISKIGDSARKVGGTFQRVGQMGLFGGVTQNARIAANAMGGFGRTVARVGSSIGALVGVAGFGGLAYEMQNYINTTDQLAKTSSRIGVTVEQLQQLRHSADLSGVSADTLETSLTRLNRGMAASVAAKKPDELAQLMNRLGVSMRDSKGNIRTAADVLPQLANAMMKNTNATTRARMAQTLFGKSGQDMILMLMQGGEAMESQMKALARLGIITTEQAAAAEEAQDAQTDMNKAIGGTANAIYAQLLPSLTPVIKQITEWTVANREWVVSGITKAIWDFSAAMKAIDWEPWIKAAKDFGAVLKIGFDAIGGWNTVLPALAVVLGGSLLAGIYAVTAAVVAMNLAMLSNPFVLGAAAIGAAAFAIYRYWGPITKFFTGLWDDVKATFDQAVAWLQSFGSQFAAGFIEDAWNPLVEWFGTLWADVKTKFWEAVAWVGDFTGLFSADDVYTAWTGMVAWFGKLWTDVKTKFWEATAWVSNFSGEFVPQQIMDAWASLTAWFGTLWSNTKTKFWEAITWVSDFVGQFIPQPIKDTWNGLTAWFGTMWENVKTNFNTIVTWLPTFIGQFIPQPIKDAWNGLTAWFGTMWENVKTNFNTIVTWLPTFIGQFIPQPIKDAWNGIVDYFQGLWDRVIGVFITAWNKIKEIIGWIMGKVQPAIDAANKVGAAIAKINPFGGGEPAKAPEGGMYGGAPATTPVAGPYAPQAVSPGQVPYGYSPTQAATAQAPPPQRIEGETKVDIRVHTDPGIDGDDNHAGSRTGQQ